MCAPKRWNRGWSVAGEERVPDDTGIKKAFGGLRDITFTIQRGELVLITGMIGSGKLSLLSALAGFMKLANPGEGILAVHDDLLLCLSPWIQNASVHNNILFGRLMDRRKNDAVVSACCLGDDLQQLLSGDCTEIGERGITLSGGQKARIALARAVYHGCGVMLFDDVLSVVDARVGRQIISNLFEGLLADCARVLATHQLSLALSADKIIFLNSDGTIDLGSAAELSERNAGFHALFEYSNEQTSASDEREPRNGDVNYFNEDIAPSGMCLLPNAKVPSPSTLESGGAEWGSGAPGETLSSPEMLG